MSMDKPLRILHVFSIMNRGGAESRVMDIYRNIDRDAVQFDFMVNNNQPGYFEPEILSMGGRIYRTKRFSFLNFYQYYKGWKAFLSECKDYQILHIHIVKSAVPILLAARKCGIRHLICHARNGSDKFLNSLYAKACRLPIRLLSEKRLAVSDYAGKFFFGKDYTVIPNAIDAAKFSYNLNTRNELRKDLKLENAFVVGNIARFHMQKNHVFLLEAVAMLKNEIPELKLLLVGDGALRETILDALRRLNIENKVVLLGERDDIPALLQAMDVFVMPSLFEGLPGAALEAQAAGLQVLLADTITKEACVINGLVEYLPISDPNIWSEKILYHYRNPARRKNTYEEFCRAGFDISTVARQYQNMYLNMIL